MSRSAKLDDLISEVITNEEIIPVVTKIQNFSAELNRFLVKNLHKYGIEDYHENDPRIATIPANTLVGISVILAGSAKRLYDEEKNMYMISPVYLVSGDELYNALVKLFKEEFDVDLIEPYINTIDSNSREAKKIFEKMRNVTVESDDDNRTFKFSYNKVLVVQYDSVPKIEKVLGMDNADTSDEWI